MSLGVGIHENVFVEAVSIDAKDTIHITFNEVAKAGKEKKSLFAMAASSEVENIDAGTNIMLFPPTPPKEDSTDTLEKKLKRTVGDINKVKGQCLHILEQFYTKTDLKDKMQPFAGLNMSDANFETEVLKKEVLLAVQRNIARTFIEMMAPFVGKPEHAMRLLLIRQSEAKHFATLRGTYLDDQPFLEPMVIPKADSKLKFSPWEIQNGYDSGIPVPKTAKAGTGDAAAPAGGAAPVSASNIFS